MVKPDTTTPSRTSAQLVRQGVRDLLASSASYNVLPADRRRKIAKDTVRVAAYMVDPQGLLTAEFRSPLLAGVVLSETGRRSAGFGKPVLDAIQMSPRSMDTLLAAVDFPSFVADLIQGVFGAIVNASVKQMEAYAALITAVSLSVDQFVQANITEDSARHALVNEFPNAASWAGAGTLRLKLHAPARSPNLTMLAAAIGLRELVDEPQRAREVKRVIAGARRRLAPESPADPCDDDSDGHQPHGPHGRRGCTKVIAVITVHRVTTSGEARSSCATAAATTWSGSTYPRSARLVRDVMQQFSGGASLRAYLPRPSIDKALRA